MDMARNHPIWRELRGVSFAFLALAAGGCAQSLAFGEPQLPNSGVMTGPLTYRDLSTVPAKPPAPQPEAQQQALDGLDADRATTAKAADSLRDAPFDMPAPAPPPVEITP
jgi:hypothetical protein